MTEGRKSAAPSAAPSRGAARVQGEVLGLVLCGGESRRMGIDKALLRPDSTRTLLENAVEALFGAGRRGLDHLFGR